jgi:prefoldin subunit 5
MYHAREIIGALTQARVQTKAATEFLKDEKEKLEDDQPDLLSSIDTAAVELDRINMRLLRIREDIEKWSRRPSQG